MQQYTIRLLVGYTEPHAHTKAKLFQHSYISAIRDHGKQYKIVCKEGAAILAIGWRCLYAEITRARIGGTEIKLNQALRRTFAMLISRVKA